MLMDLLTVLQMNPDNCNIFSSIFWQRFLIPYFSFLTTQALSTGTEENTLDSSLEGGIPLSIVSEDSESTSSAKLSTHEVHDQMILRIFTIIIRSFIKNDLRESYSVI